jgi:anaerobic selenocysteine-containing dehydrogenase
MRAAQQRKATLLVIDPRRTKEAEAADLWLRPRPGTDAALALGFLHVIITEERYDRAFVERWTVGFDALVQRVQAYPPDRVAAWTGVPAEDIRHAARLYATHHPAALFPSLPIGMGRNALNWTRALACLIAICGHLDVPGGNRLVGPPADFFTIKDICDYAALPPTQRAKRLGADRFRLHHEGYERLHTAMQRVWYGKPYVLLQDAGASAHPPTLWRTILTAQPYPVRALFVQANNVLGCYPNTQLAYQALTSANLELLVVHEQFMTPTAQLADYVLPAAGWLEKPFLSTRGVFATAAVVPAYGERRSDYQLWADLAARLDLHGPWPSTLEGLYDLMLQPMGRRFAELARGQKPWRTAVTQYRRHEEEDAARGGFRGFGTPTGKVELHSTILADLGYDPLPSFEEPLAPAFGQEAHYPFLLATGATVIEMTHQDHRQMPTLRRRHPEPTVEIPPEIAGNLEIETGDWVWVETPKGRVRQRAKITPGLHPQMVMAERWWYPERPGAAPELYGMWESNINAYIVVTSFLDY